MLHVIVTGDTKTSAIEEAVLLALERHREYLDSTGTTLRSLELVVKMDHKNGGAGLVLVNPVFEDKT